MRTARWETAKARDTVAPQEGGCNGPDAWRLRQGSHFPDLRMDGTKEGTSGGNTLVKLWDCPIQAILWLERGKWGRPNSDPSPPFLAKALLRFQRPHLRPVPGEDQLNPPEPRATRLMQACRRLAVEQLPSVRNRQRRPSANRMRMDGTTARAAGTLRPAVELPTQAKRGLEWGTCTCNPTLRLRLIDLRLILHCR